jgi:hypothetical protein
VRLTSSLSVQPLLAFAPSLSDILADMLYVLDVVTWTRFGIVVDKLVSVVWKRAESASETAPGWDFGKFVEASLPSPWDLAEMSET